MRKEAWEYVAFYDGALAIEMAGARRGPAGTDQSWKNDPEQRCECRARKSPRRPKCRPCLQASTGAR